MYEDLPGLPAFLTLIALAPAFLTWRRGRVLARALEDPALPERLEAERRRNGSSIAVAFGIAAVMSPGSLLWTLPLLIVGQVVAAYPLRKVLYAETWTFRTYLALVGRLAIAIWGFWILLAMLPLQAPEFGRYDWLVALAGAIALLLWNARADLVLRRLLGSRPLTDPVLIARFTAIAERSGVPVPNFECVPLHGGAISNAIAVPARRRSSVLFTDTLLTHLDVDEAAAICAHEIAHLEHHTPRLLRRIDVANIAIIVLGAFLAVLPRFAGWQGTALSSVLWIVALFGVVAWRARDRQRHETASDLRAIALTGDPDALIRALTKLYAFARLPRRIDADVERRATHPSLARRIRDIRTAAGAAPATLGATSLFVAADGRSTVTFDSDRLQWAEGDVATYTLNYSQFAELRLQVAADGTKSLVAVERGGRRWQTRLADADVSRLQAVLDIVDARVAGEARPPVTFGNLARGAAACAAAFALALTQIAMAIVALLALLQPSAAMLAGAGVAALASALAVFRAFSGAPLDSHIGLTAMVALLGLALLASAYARRGDRLPRRAMAGVAALVLCAAVSTGVLLLNGVHPIDLHLAARSNPSSGIFTLALGTTLAVLHVRAVRYLAAPVLLGGLAILAAGSAWFLDRVGRDPLLQPAPQIAWSTVEGTLMGEMTLPLYASSVELSPNGRALIVQGYDPAEEELTLYVARTGGTITRVHATDLMFMDDARVLGVYDTAAGALEIRETAIDAPESVAWHRPLPAFVPGAISYERSTRTWTVRGFAADGALVQVQGHDGAPTTRETRWAALGIGRVPEHAAVTGETAVVHDTQYTPSLLQRHGWWQLALLLPGNHAQSRFTRLTGTARTDAAITRFQTECVSAGASHALLCSAFDGTRTRFASIDAGTAEVTALAWLPGHFRGSILSASGWLSGWADWNAVAVRPATGEGLRYTGAPGRITQLAVNDRAFAVVSMRGGESIVRIYSRDDARRASR